MVLAGSRGRLPHRVAEGIPERAAPPERVPLGRPQKLPRFGPARRAVGIVPAGKLKHLRGVKPGPRDRRAFLDDVHGSPGRVVVGHHPGREGDARASVEILGGPRADVIRGAGAVGALGRRLRPRRRETLVHREPGRVPSEGRFAVLVVVFPGTGTLAVSRGTHAIVRGNLRLDPERERRSGAVAIARLAVMVLPGAGLRRLLAEVTQRATDRDAMPERERRTCGARGRVPVAVVIPRTGAGTPAPGTSGAPASPARERLGPRAHRERRRARGRSRGGARDVIRGTGEVLRPGAPPRVRPRLATAHGRRRARRVRQLRPRRRGRAVFAGTGELRRRAKRRILHPRVHRERGRALPRGGDDGVLSRTGNLARAFRLPGGIRDFPRDGERGSRERRPETETAGAVAFVFAGAGDARLVPGDVHRATHAKPWGERERGTLAERVRVVVLRAQVGLVRAGAGADAARRRSASLGRGFAAVSEREPEFLGPGLGVVRVRAVRGGLVVAVAVVIAGTGTRGGIVAGSRGARAEGKRGAATAGALDAVADVHAQFVEVLEIFSNRGSVPTGTRGRPVHPDFTPERESSVSRPADVAVVRNAGDVVRAGAGNVDGGSPRR